MRSLLALALLGAPVLAQEPAAVPRTFLVELGQPDLIVEVNGLESVTDAAGTLRLTVRAAPGETLSFRSLDEAWTLDARRIVPVEDPSVPVLWDLSSELRLVETPAPEPPPTSGAPPAPDPCRDPGSLRCRQARWTRLESALARQDCRAALRTVAELESQHPELAAAGDSAVVFARTYLDCGLLAGDEGLLRRSVELAAGLGDELWCDVAGARLLARGFEALGLLETAAEEAREARSDCEAPEAALEWEFYFRYQLGQFERCSALAAEAPGRQGLFLDGWLGLARGECASEVELEPTGDLPCRALPQEFCSRLYGRILLACGDAPEDFAAAARYLRAALPVEPEAWDDLARGRGRGLLTELAEAEVLKGDFAAAIGLYERLLKLGAFEAGADARRGALRRLYGDALLFSDGDSERRAALGTYRLALQDLAGDPVAFAIVMNNVCVLRGRLGETMSSADFARDLEIFEASLGNLSEDEARLRLWLRHNLLSIRIDLLEKDRDLDAQEKLVRLEALRAPFAEYQRELESLASGARAPLRTFRHEGRRYALALP